MVPDSDPTSRTRQRNVLVPYNGSPRSERALEYACASFPNDDLVLLYVLDRDGEAAAKGFVDDPAGFGEWIDDREAQADREVFANARRIAEKYDQSVTTAVAVGGVERAVVEYWTANEFDFVVMDVQGRGLRRVLGYVTGDVGERFARTASVPAVLVREDMALPSEKWSPSDGRELLVPFDLSVRSRNALEFACSVFPDADVTALCMYAVWGSYDAVLLDRLEDVFEARQERMNELVATAERIAADYDTTVDTTFGYGALDRTTLRYLDANDVDLVVVGTRGKATLGELASPSASERLVGNCPVPLAVVPTPVRR